MRIQYFCLLSECFQNLSSEIETIGWSCSVVFPNLNVLCRFALFFGQFTSKTQRRGNSKHEKRHIKEKKNITSFPELPVNIPWLNTVHRVFNLLWNICGVMHVGLNQRITVPSMLRLFRRLLDWEVYTSTFQGNFRSVSTSDFMVFS